MAVSGVRGLGGWGGGGKKRTVAFVTRPDG